MHHQGSPAGEKRMKMASAQQKKGRKQVMLPALKIE